jgi:DNA-3-methyladenine glycosylase II
MNINSLTEETYKEGLNCLSRIDPEFEQVINTFGPPPMWNREPGFATLIHIMLEQQVSLASAKAAYDKLQLRLETIDPERFLELDNQELREIGFSRQKTRYAQNIASAILSGNLDLEDLNDQSDDIVRRHLQTIIGIGPWTADIYLLMALNRADIWPQGDLALLNSIQSLKRLPIRPSSEDFKQMGEKWKPWRAIAARILWHHYLSKS